MSSTVRKQTIVSSDTNSFAILSIPDEMHEDWASFLDDFEEEALCPLPQTYGEANIVSQMFGLISEDIVDVCLGNKKYVELSADAAVYKKERLSSNVSLRKGDIIEERWNSFIDKEASRFRKESEALSSGSTSIELVAPTPVLLSNSGSREPATKIPPGEGFTDRLNLVPQIGRKWRRKKNRVPHYVYTLVSPVMKTTRVVRERQLSRSESEITEGLRQGSLKLVRVNRKVGQGYTSIEHHVVRVAPRTLTEIPQSEYEFYIEEIYPDIENLFLPQINEEE